MIEVRDGPRKTGLRGDFVDMSTDVAPSRQWDGQQEDDGEEHGERGRLRLGTVHGGEMHAGTGTDWGKRSPHDFRTRFTVAEDKTQEE